MEHAEQAQDADGVLVVSAWTHGPGGRLLARVTLTAKDADDVVEVVSTPAEVRRLVDRWLESLET